MIKNLFLAVMLTVTLAACKSKGAFNYSEEIVKKERSLIGDITKTESDVEKFIAAGQYDSMAVVSERMEGIVNTKLEEVKALKKPKAKEVDNFRDAAISYFEFMKSMYSGYKAYAKAGSDEARNEELTKLQELLGKKDEAIRNMQNAQKKYADANGFKIEADK